MHPSAPFIVISYNRQRNQSRVVALRFAIPPHADDPILSFDAQDNYKTSAFDYIVAVVLVPPKYSVSFLIEFPVCLFLSFTSLMIKNTLESQICIFISCTSLSTSLSFLNKMSKIQSDLQTNTASRFAHVQVSIDRTIDPFSGMTKGTANFL